MFAKKNMDELHRPDMEVLKKMQRHPVYIILDDIRSMQNVGSVFRTSDAFLVKEILLCGYTPTPPHRDINKSALGATETVPWRHADSTSDAVDWCKKNNITTFAIEQTHNSTTLSDFKWTGEKPIALVFGNEVNGVNDEVLSKIEGVLEVPQWGHKHSLNISVCVGIVLWACIGNHFKS